MVCAASEIFNAKIIIHLRFGDYSPVFNLSGIPDFLNKNKIS
jgi:hypothetical protein